MQLQALKICKKKVGFFKSVSETQLEKMFNTRQQKAIQSNWGVFSKSSRAFFHMTVINESVATSQENGTFTPTDSQEDFRRSRSTFDRWCDAVAHLKQQNATEGQLCLIVDCVTWNCGTKIASVEVPQNMLYFPHSHPIKTQEPKSFFLSHHETDLFPMEAFAVHSFSLKKVMESQLVGCSTVS